MKKLLAIIALALALPLSAGVAALAQEPGPWVYGQHNRWDPSWNRRPDPRRGACFYTTAPFRGNRFCVRSGDRLPALPEDFGDNISSIQTFGGARVKIFNDRGFSGGGRVVDRSVPDLRSLRFRGGHTWNNRISSLMVF